MLRVIVLFCLVFVQISLLVSCTSEFQINHDITCATCEQFLLQLNSLPGRSLKCSKNMRNTFDRLKNFIVASAWKWLNRMTTSTASALTSSKICHYPILRLAIYVTCSNCGCMFLGCIVVVTTKRLCIAGQGAQQREEAMKSSHD